MIPAASVTVAGLGRTTLGFREMDSIVLKVTGADGSIELPLVPMRLKGNPVRALSAIELQNVARQIEQALDGRELSQPEWVY